MLECCMNHRGAAGLRGLGDSFGASAPLAVGASLAHALNITINYELFKETII